MSQAEVVARSTRGPVTRAWLGRDLAALGVKPGMLLMVHASLSQLGWVIGGPMTVVAALCDALGLPCPHPGMNAKARGSEESGTLVMPTFSTDNGEPSGWRHPPVPESWWQTIREETPPYDPRSAPTRKMGAIPDYFRSLPGTLRSAHPILSWTALGPLAQQVMANHSLDMCLGEETPQGRCYERGGYVLSLATRRTTILHLAEYRAEYPGKFIKRHGAAVLKDGRRDWATYEDVHGVDSDFEQLRQDFMAARPEGDDSWREGPVAYSTSRLFAIRPLIDFAVQWMEQHRTAALQEES